MNSNLLFAASNGSSFQLPFSPADVVLTASILIFLIIFAITTNLVTIAVIASSSNLKTTFNYLIGSLCVSDLISAVITPLFLYRRTWGFEEWYLSAFVCKASWGIRLWTAYVTSIHILLFSLLRYISVKSASHYYEISKNSIKKAIMFVWVVAFVVGFIPFSIMFDAKHRDINNSDLIGRPSCTVYPEWIPSYIFYTSVGYSVFFYIPMILITMFSTSTILVLFKKRGKRKVIISSRKQHSLKTCLEETRQQNEKQVMIQLVLIAASFALGYLPFTIYGFFTTTVTSNTVEERRNDWRFGVAELICLRISECLNPIFYNLASSTLRNETLKFFRRLPICKMFTSSSNIAERSSSNFQQERRPIIVFESNRKTLEL